MNRIPLNRWKELAGITASGANVRDIAERAVESARLPFSEPNAARCRWVIGIDPGVESGFAVWDRATRQFQEITTLDFWTVLDRVQIFGVHEVKIIVEIASHAPLFWQRKESAQNAHTLARKAQNVGQVRREAALLVEELKRRGYTVTEVKPQGKKDQAEFKRITGWQKRTNAHERDAGMLAYFA